MMRNLLIYIANGLLLCFMAPKFAFSYPCPLNIIPNDMGHISQFKDGLERVSANVNIQARHLGLNTVCREDEGKSNVVAGISVSFRIHRGPANVSKDGNLRYFIAVTDKARNILFREEFPLNVNFPNNEKTISHSTKPIAINLPLKPGIDIFSYSIYSGFLLSREQLAYNRGQKQVKEPEITKPPTSEAVKKPPVGKTINASSGSGFAVSSSGHVITNNHVINGCQNVKIHHKGKAIKATVVTYDPQNDLALLKGNFRPSTVFSLSKSNPELLQDVYVAGYPFGKKISTSVKVTKGIVSSLTGIGNNFSNIQIDAAIQPGNSGGPILNEQGNVVGVAVAKLDLKKVLKDFGVIPEDTNFGIKSNVVKSLLESNNVALPRPNTNPISKSKLGKMISDGTYYLSCWMTMAQIEKMKSRKVIFQNLD